MSGLLQVWYVATLSDNLRFNSPEVPPNRHYDLRSSFTENSFLVRRSELRFWARPLDQVELVVMVDPAIGIASSNLLQDAILRWTPTPRLELRVGQMKTLQTHEGLASSAELLFAERGQGTRQYGDTRDRGAVVAYRFGTASGRSLHASFGVFNGAGKGAESNGSKDVAARIEWTRGGHDAGVYGLLGSSDLAEAVRVPLDFAGTGPSPEAIVDEQDRTSRFGAFYVYHHGPWRFELEALMGRLGRQRPSLGNAPGPARREHLLQQFLSLQATAAWTHGHHTWAVRWDRFDANNGSDWYTTYDPYRQSDQAVPRDGDYTPTFTEWSIGYVYALEPSRLASASLRLSYVARSDNFLLPRDDQSGPQGGDSLVAVFQVAF